VIRSVLLSLPVEEVVDEVHLPLLDQEEEQEEQRPMILVSLGLTYDSPENLLSFLKLQKKL
jgi:hypothetical protein